MTKGIALTLVLAISPPAALAGSSLREAYLRSLPREYEMEAFVRLMFESLGLPNKVTVVIDPEAKRSCAYATTVGGKQFIGVFLPCTGPLRFGQKYNWDAAGTLAHEVAHILAADTTDADHGPRDEAEADEWTGWQLRRMGATLAEAQMTFLSVSEKGSRTHPPRAERLLAVERGWNRAGAPTLPLPAPIPPPSEAVIAQAPPVAVPQPVPAPATRPQPAPPVKTKSLWQELMSKRLPWAQTGVAK